MEVDTGLVADGLVGGTLERRVVEVEEGEDSEEDREDGGER